MNISKLSRLVGMIAAVAMLTACDTDGPLDPSRIPTLPPAGGFDADFSFFAETEPASGGTTTAWSMALARATAANEEMAGILAVPLAALTDAAGATPERSGSIWAWPVDFSVDGVAYEGELRGSVAGGNYGWDLILTAPTHAPPLTNYLWMSGFSGATGQEGNWYIADSDAGTNDAIASVAWERGAQNTASFAFSATSNTAWVYQREGGTNTLTYLVGGQLRHVTIWTPANGTGSVWTSETDETLCWNGSQHDVACS